MDEKQLVDQLSYICGYCDRTFVYKEVMNMHKDVMHSKQTEDKIVQREKKYPVYLRTVMKPANIPNLLKNM